MGRGLGGHCAVAGAGRNVGAARARLPAPPRALPAAAGAPLAALASSGSRNMRVCMTAVLLLWQLLGAGTLRPSLSPASSTAWYSFACI